MISPLSCVFALAALQACAALALPEDGVKLTTTGAPKNASQPATLPDSYNLDDVLATITAEFIFVVAGEHILMPEPDPVEDAQLHRRAVVLARLLQKLHCAEKIYDMLNQTAMEVAVHISHQKVDRNLLSEVFDKLEERLKEDEEMSAEYANELEKVENLAIEPKIARMQNSSVRNHTAYEITPEQIMRGEELLHQPKVKVLILCVSVLQQSQQRLEMIAPDEQRLRGYTVLAKAIYKMAEKPELRERLQKAFDEAVAGYAAQFDVLYGGEDRVFYEELAKKIESNEQLKSALEAFKSSLQRG